jgi:uncharacterized protein YciI
VIVVLLSYRVPPERIAEARERHLAWLGEARDAGRLLLSARNKARDGGILLVRGAAAEVEAWCATDPFATEGLADYRYIEVEPSLTAAGLEALAG